MRIDMNINLPKIDVHIHIHDDVDAEALIKRLKKLGVKIEHDTTVIKEAIHE